MRRCTRGHARSFERRFSPITIRRTRGGCQCCKKWIYPADGLLGLEDTAEYWPGVREMAALAVCKLPVTEASAVIERLTGVKLPRATLDREACGKVCERRRSEARSTSSCKPRKRLCRRCTT